MGTGAYVTTERIDKGISQANGIRSKSTLPQQAQGSRDKGGVFQPAMVKRNINSHFTSNEEENRNEPSI